MRPYQIYNPGPTILSGFFLSAEQEKQRRIGNNNADYLIISGIFAKFAMRSVGWSSHTHEPWIATGCEKDSILK